MKRLSLSVLAVVLVACSGSSTSTGPPAPDLQYRLILDGGSYTVSHDSVHFAVILQSQVVPATTPDTFLWSPVPNATLATNWAAGYVTPTPLVTDGNGVARGVWYFGAPTDPGIEWSMIITWPAQPPGAAALITLYGWSGTTP